MRQKNSPSSEPLLMADEPVAYRLAFRDTGKAAKLTSPKLDRAMHARGGVTVAFESLRSRQGGMEIELDAFEAASSVGYLQNQETVRRELERELDDLLETWDEEMEIGRGPNVWARTTIQSVEFSPRQVPTPEQLHRIRKRHGRDAQKIIRENFDTADARSSFLVEMRPEWIGDHLLLIQFRDGKAMGLQLEG